MEDYKKEFKYVIENKNENKNDYRNRILLETFEYQHNADFWQNSYMDCEPIMYEAYYNKWQHNYKIYLLLKDFIINDFKEVK